MSVVFVCVKRATTMGVVGGWTGGLVCAVDAKYFNASKTQIGWENSAYSQNATQLLYYSTLKAKDFRD